MQVWRLTKTRYVDIAFDGEGACIYGARWNSRGTRVIYASSNSALAVLEVLVHLIGAGPLVGYSLLSASIPDALIEGLAPPQLPKDWDLSPIPLSVQGVGDDWIRSGRSLALRVPSVIVDGGFNILINPEHPAFDRVHIESISEYNFDPRLIR